ncbi:MAG: hypothetical protein HUK22_05415, partial [Thermoguttaceae bacterium]|nr:hypothetical protein [Thermoguttaceae bacterium]
LSGFTFCGDGEPTLSPDFGATVDAAIEARAEVGREDLGLALITNSTRLTAPEILPALDRFVAAGGEIWAKLDAGTPERYRAINRSAVPFEKILENIRFAAARWGVKIQTAALEWDGEKPTVAGVRAYCAAVREIAAAGRVSEIQFYTVARVPQDARAIALSNAEMDALAAEIRAQTGLDVPVFYSS